MGKQGAVSVESIQSPKTSTGSISFSNGTLTLIGFARSGSVKIHDLKGRLLFEQSGIIPQNILIPNMHGIVMVSVESLAGRVAKKVSID